MTGPGLTNQTINLTASGPNGIERGGKCICGRVVCRSGAIGVGCRVGSTYSLGNLQRRLAIVAGFVRDLLLVDDPTLGDPSLLAWGPLVLCIDDGALAIDWERVR